MSDPRSSFTPEELPSISGASHAHTGQARFLIKSRTAGYKPKNGKPPITNIREQTIAQWNSQVALESDLDSQPAMPYYFVLEPRAQNSIFEHIGWLSTRPENDVEQGGLLLGEVIEAPSGQLVGVAKIAIPALRGQGSSTYLKLDHAAWKAMYDEIDATKDKSEAEQIIGWYHTHPRGLPVFMSGTDRNTQQTMFAQDWHFAIVLNPHKNLWEAFHGAGSDVCPGYMMNNAEIRVPSSDVSLLKPSLPASADVSPHLKPGRGLPRFHRVMGSLALMCLVFLLYNNHLMINLGKAISERDNKINSMMSERSNEINLEISSHLKKNEQAIQTALNDEFFQSASARKREQESLSEEFVKGRKKLESYLDVSRKEAEAIRDKLKTIENEVSQMRREMNARNSSLEWPWPPTSK